MNKSLTHMTSTGARAIMALAFAAFAWLPQAARAQSTTVPNLTVHSCDGQSFPQVTCMVTAVDRGGVPAQGLSAASFDVSDSGGSVANLAVTQNVNSGVATSVLFLVDLSASLRGNGDQDLKDTMDKILDDMAKDPSRQNDLVALLVLTKPTVDVGTNPSSPPMDPATELPFSIDKVLPRNTLRPLTPSSPTPLHDGVRKALILTSQQPLGKRAIVVMSDGLDSRSSGFTIDSDVSEAQRDIVPIYTLKYGTNVDTVKLQRMAIDTGGEVILQGGPAQVSAAIKKIQDKLKTQYVLTFKSNATASKAQDVTIRWKNPAGVVESKGTLSKAPVPPPAITGFKINDVAGDLNSVELRGDTTVEPEFKDGIPQQVQYELDGKTSVQKQPPFSFSFNADELPLDSQLVVRVFSSSNLSTTQSFSLKFGLPATPTPEPTKTPSGGIAELFKNNPMLLVAVGVAAIGLIVLLVLVALLLGRRKRNAPAYANQDYAVPATSVQSDGATAVQGDMGGDMQAIPQQPEMLTTTLDAPPPLPAEEGGGATQVLGVAQPPDMEGGKTMVMPQLARAQLEFIKGDRVGDKVKFGIPGRDTPIGRGANDASDGIHLGSNFASRKHATVTVAGDQIMLTDLGSASGTVVNGVKLAPNTPTPVKIGDKIEFADVETHVIAP